MKNKCKDCYVEVRRYTFIRGIFSCLLVTIFLMIPILNLFVLKEMVEGEKFQKDFWRNCWYDIERIKVKQ